jgi:hypothetical protein
MPTPLFVAARKRAHSLEKTLAEYLRYLVEFDLTIVKNQDKQIKLCPICGGESELEDYRDGGGNGYAVHCQTFTCQTCGPTDLGTYGAISMWNERPLESQQAARILQLEQQLAAATEQVAQRERDFKGLLHKADSWYNGMEYNAQLCAEKDARIAELEAVHLVEDGELPDEGQVVLWADENETYVTQYYRGWYTLESCSPKKCVAWMICPDLLALAAQKRARRAAEAAAGGEANNG